MYKNLKYRKGSLSMCTIKSNIMGKHKMLKIKEGNLKSFEKQEVEILYRRFF